MVSAISGRGLGTLGRRVAGTQAKLGSGGASITSFVDNVASGTAPPNSPVFLTANGVTCGVTTSDSQGRWSIGNVVPGLVTLAAGVATPLLQAQAYSSWNPSDAAPGLVLSNGNRTFTEPTNLSYASVRGTLPHVSGKWYWEVKIGPFISATNGVYYGIMLGNQQLVNNWPGNLNPGNSLRPDGYYWNNGGYGAGGYTAVGGDTIMMALNLSTGYMFFGKNGTWYNNADPVAGTGSFSSVSVGYTWFPVATGNGAGDAFTLNTGGQPFVGVVPAGYLPWG